MNQPIPKSLEDAVKFGLSGPMCGIKDQTVASVRDYLSQHFQVEMCRATIHETEMLMRLWCKITGEKNEAAN